ncbi:MAG: hypothetical protein IPK83_05200 [Planctomycetes bacterium]|nr:hypothetical protein [Planctomycetota bacterium]
MPRNIRRRLFLLFSTSVTIVPICVAFSAGCTGLDLFLGPILSLFGNENANDNQVNLGIAVAEPAAPVSAAPGVSTIIRWADIAEIDGTVVRITAQRRSDEEEDTADPIELVGDGTLGSGRDALADGNNDIFEWDVTGVRVGTYVIIATIESPDGTMKTVMSRDPDRETTGVIVVTTALPVPTFTFTAPGAADETVVTGNAFNITWTDNGTDNPDAVVTLGLDPDSDRENGNEIILLTGQPLSENGDNGTFVFSFVDTNGDTVPDDIYNVFVIVDDNANDPVRLTAAGQLVLNP